MSEETVEKKTRDVLDAIQRDEGDVSFSDVCKTPTPGGPIPIPYPNIASAKGTSTGSKTVKIDANATMVKDSSFTTSTGDEPGHGPRVSTIDAIKQTVTFKRLGIPVWLWGVIVVGGALIVWIIASNAMRPIQPFELS